MHAFVLPTEVYTRKRDLGFFLSFLFCIEVCLINNVLTFSGEQQRDSDTHIYGLILPKLPSHPRRHVTLKRVPCAVWWVFVGYPF